MAFSGGVGWGQPDAAPEARVAAKIAAEEFNRPIKWVEDDSRDTRENASRTMALLKPAGIDHIVLVTHGYHMARALRAFVEAAGPGVQIEAAPMGLARRLETPALAWMPSAPRLPPDAPGPARADRQAGGGLISAGAPMSWHGSLALDYRLSDERTLVHDRHDGPLRVLKGFHPGRPARLPQRAGPSARRDRRRR